MFLVSNGIETHRLNGRTDVYVCVCLWTMSLMLTVAHLPSCQEVNPRERVFSNLVLAGTTSRDRVACRHCDHPLIGDVRSRFFVCESCLLFGLPETFTWSKVVQSPRLVRVWQSNTTARSIVTFCTFLPYTYCDGACTRCPSRFCTIAAGVP